MDENEKEMYVGLFIWNNASMGDVLITVALIDKLLKKYNNLTITLGCWKKFIYLADHLPINIMGFVPVPGVENYYFNKFIPKHFFDFNSQFGAIPYVGKKFQWKYAIENFNIELSQSELFLEYEELEIELPDLNINVPENTIFIENGESYSGHNDFFVNVDYISLKFPEYKFYCTSDPKSNNPNVIDLSNKNAIYLQSVQRKAKAIIGKGSGPFILSFNKDCRDTPKALFGFKTEEFSKLWDENAPIEYFEGTDEAVVQFIQTLK